MNTADIEAVSYAVVAVALIGAWWDLARHDKFRFGASKATPEQAPSVREGGE